MVDAAVGLAVLGAAIGAAFRLKVLLLTGGLLLVVSVSIAVFRGFNFLETALTIMASQSILQISYFLGLLARAWFAAAHRTRPVL